MIWVLRLVGFIFLFLDCFQMGFYFVTTGWIFKIGLCMNSINKSINHTTASRSTAIAFSVMIHFAMKNYALLYCLYHSPTSSAALICWSVLIPKTLRSSMHSFSFSPPGNDTPCDYSEHLELRQRDAELRVGTNDPIIHATKWKISEAVRWLPAF